MSALEGLEDFVRDKVEKERWTHKQISAFLEGIHPGQRGFSVRSVERFCSYKGIHKTPRLDDQTLDEAVSRATDMVSNVMCHWFVQCPGWKFDITASPPNFPANNLFCTVRL